MFQAWAAYDDTAVGTEFGNEFRRPQRERTFENKIGHPIIEVIKAFSSKNKIIFNTNQHLIK
jgi:hypothetical protein